MKSEWKLAAGIGLLMIYLVVMAMAIRAHCVSNEVGGSVAETAIVESNNNPRFQRVMKDSGSALCVYVDTETGVMYMIRSSAGGICVMVDAVGNPLLWDGGTTK